MKNIVVGIVASCLLLAGCDEPQKDARGRLASQEQEDGTFMLCIRTGFGAIAQYVVIDGHEYLFVRYDRGCGITHSPKCDCHSRK